jgi:hypothetical protein
MRIRILGSDAKCYRIFQLENNSYFFYQKIAIGPHPRTPKLQEKPPALKREQEPENNIFLPFFLLWWVIFSPPGSNSGSEIPMRIRIKNKAKKTVRIHADPDATTILRSTYVLVNGRYL